MNTAIRYNNATGQSPITNRYATATPPYYFAAIDYAAGHNINGLLPLIFYADTPLYCLRLIFAYADGWLR